jgi:hypothetical protein
VPSVAVPLDHEYVAPPLAVTEILVCVQVRTVVFELFRIPATGAVMFWVTIELAVLEQPLAPVTVTE